MGRATQLFPISQFFETVISNWWHNPHMCWNLRTDIPMLDSAQIWGCCHATVGQRKTSLLTPATKWQPKWFYTALRWQRAKQMTAARENPYLLGPSLTSHSQECPGPECLPSNIPELHIGQAQLVLSFLLAFMHTSILYGMFVTLLGQNNGFTPAQGTQNQTLYPRTSRGHFPLDKNSFNSSRDAIGFSLQTPVQRQWRSHKIHWMFHKARHILCMKIHYPLSRTVWNPPLHVCLTIH